MPAISQSQTAFFKVSTCRPNPASGCCQMSLSLQNKVGQQLPGPAYVCMYTCCFAEKILSVRPYIHTCPLEWHFSMYVCSQVHSFVIYRDLQFVLLPLHTHEIDFLHLSGIHTYGGCFLSFMSLCSLASTFLLRLHISTSGICIWWIFNDTAQLIAIN
jgi:hypothetical protein